MMHVARDVSSYLLIGLAEHRPLEDRPLVCLPVSRIQDLHAYMRLLQTQRRYNLSLLELTGVHPFIMICKDHSTVGHMPSATCC